ncbi:hypothetical protein LC040_12305 [Bacillus tianshenii]|nr:hypothetical protein LC040_12305 [Bacillus tianshenii]
MRKWGECMTGHAEISGLLSSVELVGSAEFNEWTKKNPDVEVVHLNTMPDEDGGCFLYSVIYRNE